jgi:hypothetical protein
MQKGPPILRSALIGVLRLELTYRDLLAHEWTGELQRDDQARRKVELLTADEYETSESLVVPSR